MNTLLLIRHLGYGDLDDLLALYAYLHTSDAPLPERSVVDAVWKELMGNSRYRYYGGFVGGHLVTTCTLTIIPNLTRGCRPYGLIENVVTHVRHRRRGFGTAVLHRARDEAWSANCYKVMLATSRKDDATTQFYVSAGFDSREKQVFVLRPPAPRNG